VARPARRGQAGALLEQLNRQVAPQLVDAFGIGADTAAEVLIVAGDNPDRVRTEAAWARLCGVAPIPASSGTTTRHRLNRGGHRQANAALYRVVIVRMQHHQPTRAYVAKRTTEGRSKAEIIRCLIGGVSGAAAGSDVWPWLSVVSGGWPRCRARPGPVLVLPPLARRGP
jgi:hypothetical protein